MFDKLLAEKRRSGKMVDLRSIMEDDPGSGQWPVFYLGWISSKCVISMNILNIYSKKQQKVVMISRD